MSSFLEQDPEIPVFFHDPGHGWLRLRRSALESHGIQEKISSYSYQSTDGQFVFLEEDRDLDVFVKALGVETYNAWKDMIPSIYDADEQVRKLPRYVPHN